MSGYRAEPGLFQGTNKTRPLGGKKKRKLKQRVEETKMTYAEKKGGELNILLLRKKEGGFLPYWKYSGDCC